MATYTGSSATSCTYTGDSLLNVYQDVNDYDGTYIQSIIEEFINVSGFPVGVHILSNRLINPTPIATADTPYSEMIENLDPVKGDPILGETGKRTYNTPIIVKCVPDSLVRENFLEKFGLFNQEQVQLLFATTVVDATFGRKLTAGDIIEFPVRNDRRWYEVSDAVKEDFQLYHGLVWKVTVTPATHSQDNNAIATDPTKYTVPYNNTLLNNSVIEELSNKMGNSGLDFLDPVY